VTSTGIHQPLLAMKDAVTDAAGGDHPEALFVMSPLGEFAVFEMTGGSVVEAGGEITSVTIDFRGDTPAYLALSKNGVISATLKTVAYAGILEEYQFYVRALRSIPGDNSSELMPQLVRARLYPNTGTPWGGDAASLTEVVADNVIDLQVAIGIDSDLIPDGSITEGTPGGSPEPEADEWLFNDPADDVDDAKWNVATNPLFYVRINTTVRTDRPEPYYTDDALETVEDKSYASSSFDLGTQRRYHRRQLRTTVDLRNL
jgi:hypothetical protein